MMPAKLSHDILAAAIEGFEAQKKKIDDKIAEIRQMLSGGPTETVATHEAPIGKRKKFSVAARKRMAEAQKLRYAKLKGETEPPSTVTPEAPKAKRKISAEGMKRIIAATKKRWRRQKAEAAEKSAPAPAKTASVKKAAVKGPSAKATKKAAPVKRAVAKKSAPVPAVA
jgi:large subunit ribosomal protein L22e